jgi:hypothetical protein
MLIFAFNDEQRLREQSVREWAGREVAPRIRDLDRAHTIMQADYLLGCRTGKPTRCDLPPWEGTE